MTDSNKEAAPKKTLTLSTKPTAVKAEGGAATSVQTLSAPARGTLSLTRKPVAGAAPDAGAAGRVRQSFSGGHTKSVAVEVKKRRVLKPDEVATAPPAMPQPSFAAAAAPVDAADARRLEALKNISEFENKKLSFDRSALKPYKPMAVATEEPAGEAADVHPKRILTADELRARELAELNDIESDFKTKAAIAEQQRQQAFPSRTTNNNTNNNTNTAAGAVGPAGATTRPGMNSIIGRRAGDDNDDRGGDNRNARGGRNARGAEPAAGVFRNGRISITQALSGDPEIERGRSVASFRRAREKEKRHMHQEERIKVLREVTLPEFITVQELAARMAERSGDVVKALMKMGMMVTVTQTIDADTAELVIAELGHTAKRITENDIEVAIKAPEDGAEQLVARPPVVTIMGHVDHGKTSLLDAIRKTDVVAGEAGGITQHIGAYQITTKANQKITFIDTPGHAAFTEMRARGANTTDIVVLVVAADDGIKPQTVEAISHAKAAGVPIIVAINKIDLPGANPKRVIEELLQYELVAESLGGEVMIIEVSAKQRLNLEKLEEAILLQAEVMELTANPAATATGVVVESKMEAGRGSVATVLVQRGTLKVGDIFVTGTEVGRVRALLNDKGQKMTNAGPAMPVEVVGLNGTPSAGDDFVVVENEAKARQVADFRISKRRDADAARLAKGSIEQMFAQIKLGEKKELAVVIKGDVHGSVEAIQAALIKLAADEAEVAVRILHSGVGAINESDMTLAKASRALVVGFNVRANPQAREIARRDGVDVRYYSIIYNVIDDAKALLTGLLSPTKRESFLGNAEIRQVFDLTKAGKIAGCMVTEGKIKRGAKVRLLRDGVVVHEGTLKTLKRFKEDVREAQQGYECGMAFDNYDNMAVGDIIEAFEIEETATALGTNLSSDI